MATIEEDPATIPASVAEVAARVERPARGRQVVNALRQKAKDFVSKNTPSPLQVQLKRATHAESISVPKGAVEDVVKASSTIENRREIMRHLHACLAEESSALWRRVYLGLQLVEALLQDGPEDLIYATANGHHFDLVQRLSFLERYEYSFDDRVESMIRRKAAQLRQAYLQQQLDVEAKRIEGLSGVLTGGSEEPKVATTANPAVTQGAISAAAKGGLLHEPATLGPVVAERKARIKPFLNGVASVGHNDDTSDESDAEDGNRHARPVIKRAQLEKDLKECSSNASSSTCDVGSSKSSAEVSPRAEPQLLDLLGGWTETPQQDLPPTDMRGMEAPKLSAPAAPCEDLLDMCSTSIPQPAAPVDDLLLMDVDTTASAAAVNDTIFSAAGAGPPAAQGTDWLAVASSKGISFNDEVEDLI